MADADWRYWALKRGLLQTPQWEHGENTDQELYSDWRAETEQERGKQLHNLDPREGGR